MSFFAAMGIPSAVMGLIVWKLKRVMEEREKEQEERNESEERLILLIVKSTRASISLGVATAHAMQRGYTNGDMEKALEYAEAIKNEQKEYLDKKGIRAILE